MNTIEPVSLKTLKTTDYASLIKFRIRKILMICSNYDAFILEEDGQIETQIYREYIDLNLSNPPRFIWATTSADAERIIAAVSTINAVSERTNMLSLNASIESERASEQCDGFGAVAAEISRLADRTAVSAMNVSKMVSEMNGSVELGVDDMENFAAKMKTNSDMISKLHDNLAAAEGQIAELGPKFESLATGVAGQEENARAIGMSMESLKTLAEKTRAKVDALKNVTTSISRTSESLADKARRLECPKETE